MKHQADLYRVIDFFQSISADSARTLSLIYTDDVWFKDPFNEVQGLEKVGHIFTHMFEQVDVPRFVITHSVLQLSLIPSCRRLRILRSRSMWPLSA